MSALAVRGDRIDRLWSGELKRKTGVGSFQGYAVTLAENEVAFVERHQGFRGSATLTPVKSTTVRKPENGPSETTVNETGPTSRFVFPAAK